MRPGPPQAAQERHQSTASLRPWVYDKSRREAFLPAPCSGSGLSDTRHRASGSDQDQVVAGYEAAEGTMQDSCGGSFVAHWVTGAAG